MQHTLRICWRLVRRWSMYHDCRTGWSLREGPLREQGCPAVRPGTDPGRCRPRRQELALLPLLKSSAPGIVSAGRCDETTHDTTRLRNGHGVLRVYLRFLLQVLPGSRCTLDRNSVPSQWGIESFAVFALKRPSCIVTVSSWSAVFAMFCLGLREKLLIRSGLS